MAVEIKSKIKYAWMKRAWVRLVASIGLVLLGFLILNSQYFLVQLRHIFGVKNNPSANSIVQVQDQAQTAPAAENILEIPSLDIRVPVIYIDQKTEKAYQTALINGVVHYPGTAMPGEYGNDYIFGHSSDFIFSKGKYKTVFALLPSIKMDALIYLSDGKGQVYTYKVIGQKVVAPDDLSVLDQGNNQRRLLTLQTSYPVGTALRRYVVTAEMLSK